MPVNDHPQPDHAGCGGMLAYIIVLSAWIYLAGKLGWN